MRYRSLGTTGVKVSPLCLGAMMFGAMGNPDHDDCIRIIHRGARCRHQLRRHRRRVLGRRVRGDRRQGAGRSARRHRPRDEAARADEPGPEREGQLAPVDRARGGEQPSPLADRPDRPLSSAPSRAGYRRRRHAVRALGPRASRQGELPRVVDVPRRGDRRGAVDGRAARPRTVPRRAAAVLDLRARHRGGRSPDLRAVRHGRDPVEPAERWLPDRPLPARRRRAEGRPRGADAGPLRSRAIRACSAS